MIVTLDDDEMKAIRLHGYLRQKENELAGTTNRQYNDQNAYERNVDGLMGEYALAKKYNIFLSLGIAVRKWSYDLMWRMMRTDVKVTRSRGSDLHLGACYNKDVEAFVFGIIIDNTVDFKGWYPASLLYQQANYGKMNEQSKYETYNVSIKLLNPF